MIKSDLNKILTDHVMWLQDNSTGSRANLSYANLSYTDLSDADLSGADLSGAILSGANLSGANLSGANLSGANLSDANLQDVSFVNTNLTGANLSGADLEYANLSGVNLSGADLSFANLSDANLSYTDLSDANLSQCIGVLNPIEWLSQFKRTNDGWVIAYKIFGLHRTPLTTWTIEVDSILNEVCNPLPTIDCGCGINIATLNWIEQQNMTSTIWKVAVNPIGLVVPYNTDGQFRAHQIRLIEIVEDNHETH